MKVAVRYQSRGGNTKAVAKIMAETIGGISAESIDKPITESVDILFVGGGLYMGDIDPTLKDYLDKLDPNTVKCLVAFTTTGTQDRTNKIVEIASGKGISVHDKTFCLKLFLKNHGWLGGKKGNLKLNEKQIQKTKDFVNSIIKG